MPPKEAATQTTTKIVLLGDTCVGKTAIVSRFIKNEWQASYKETSGVEFYRKEERLIAGHILHFHICDVGGNSLTEKLLANYIYGAHAVLFVYDITLAQSFTSIQKWYTLCKKIWEEDQLTTESPGEFPYLALVGSKSDLMFQRVVKANTHNEFVNENKMHGYFVSAKTGDLINSTFLQIASDLNGLKLDKADLENAKNIVKATIGGAPEENAISNAQETNLQRVKPAQTKSKTCVIQ